MRQLTILLIALLSICALAVKGPTSYCKCICFQNSTIIPLNSPPDTSSSPQRQSLHLRDDDETTDSGKKHHTLTCNDCNRAFCLDYNLPICKNAKEEDVFATCFQRDSVKDRTVVTLFLVATASLLLWALIKPYVVTPTSSDLVQKYGGRIGLGVGSEGATLPGPGSSSRGGFGRDINPEDRPRNASGARGSISRQGGLNS